MEGLSCSALTINSEMRKRTKTRKRFARDKNSCLCYKCWEKYRRMLLGCCFLTSNEVGPDIFENQSPSLQQQNIHINFDLIQQKNGRVKKGGKTRRVITKKWPSLESRSVSLVKFNGAVDLLHNSPPLSGGSRCIIKIHRTLLPPHHYSP